MAEHVEATGHFESGARNFLKRYNAIVNHLEEIGAIPEDLFPGLEEESDFGILGAEAMLLANYLEDLVPAAPEETAARQRMHDIGPLVALAPHLHHDDLAKLLHTHFMGHEPKEEPEPSEPNLQTIAGLAPHIDKATLGEMVRVCLSRQKIRDPNMLVALAPFMDSAEFSQILREHLPQMFGGQPSDATDEVRATQGKELIRTEDAFPE